ncbi:SUN domain-containing protein 3-like isoform 2-T6 [Spinachia spinachia]
MTKDIIVDKLLSWFTTSTEHQTLIQDNSMSPPGERWCFAGTEGHCVVSLSHSIMVSHVTLGHITKQQTLTGEVNSAPKREWRTRTQKASTWGPLSMTRTVPPSRPLSFTMKPEKSSATLSCG